MSQEDINEELVAARESYVALAWLATGSQNGLHYDYDTSGTVELETDTPSFEEFTDSPDSHYTW